MKPSANGCSGAATISANVTVIDAAILACSTLSVPSTFCPSSSRTSPCTRYVSAPEVERWNGHVNFAKLNGNPCSVRYKSGRGFFSRLAASAKYVATSASSSALLKSNRSLSSSTCVLAVSSTSPSVNRVVGSPEKSAPTALETTTSPAAFAAASTCAAKTACVFVS